MALPSECPDRAEREMIEYCNIRLYRPVYRTTALHCTHSRIRSCYAIGMYRGPSTVQIYY